jgi:hypothetical protein
MALPLGSIDNEHRLPFIDFCQTLLFSPRDGLAKGKKRNGIRQKDLPAGAFAPVPEIAGASLFAGLKDSLT